MRVRVKYKKGDTARFLSHLDMARNLRMALARAKWPVAMTQGYSPKMKVSFYAPLPVGTAGDEEYMDVILDDEGIAGFIQAKAKGAGKRAQNSDVLVRLARALSDVLPKGIAVSGLYVVPDGKPNFESQIRASLYRIEVEEVNTEALSSAIEEFLAQEQVLFAVQRPKQTKTVDLRRFVEKISLVPGLNPATLFMKIRHDNGRTVRPQWVIDSLSRFGMGIDTGEITVDRLKLYLE